MYKCSKCKKQIGKKIPQAKIRYYESDGNIKSEIKVCFSCKDEHNLQSTLKEKK